MSDDALNNASDDLAEADLDAALQDAADVPLPAEPLESFDLATAGEDLMRSVAVLFEAHTAKAGAALAFLGEDVVRETTKITNKMLEIGDMVAEHRLSPESAERALGHYMAALKLQAERAENQAKAIAYDRARESLMTAKSLLFAGLRVALSVGSQAATGYIGSIQPPQS